MAPQPTTVQIVPAGGPSTQFGSSFEVTRSAEGRQIGRTHRLKISGFSSLISDTSSIIAEKKMP